VGASTSHKPMGHDGLLYTDSFAFFSLFYSYISTYFHSVTVSYSWGEVRLSPLGTSATIGPIVSAPDDDECGADGGMKSGRGKPATVPLRPSQISRDLTWDSTA
jgi:hypothetical protein